MCDVAYLLLTEDVHRWVHTNTLAAALRGTQPPSIVEALSGLDLMLEADPARLTREERAALDDTAALREAVGLPPMEVR